MSDSPPGDEAIFSVARKIAPAAARVAYLREVCGDDQVLFDRVTTLLLACTEESGFLESPAICRDGIAILSAISEMPGAIIGSYKLLEQIGIGGMGLVFMAEQQQPMRRMVALKIIKPGMDTRQVIARFEAERQVLAMMDHPHIAKVLDAGATDSGRPYFVMELVRGIPVTEYCDQARLPTRDRLQLFITICEGVQHAHQKGIIHRDIKPSNILVTMHDDKAVPKVIDFGVAKATNQRLVEQTLFTNFAQMLGTPTYMSPEQAQMSGLDVDTRSDVYSLGVLLYELLTGSTPFEKTRLREAEYDELRRIIRDEEPPRPSERITGLDAASQSTIAGRRAIDPRMFTQALRGDLDWIVMKALEKNRTRRYESVSALIADVKRYLADEPVEARPPSAAYRLRKFARRNKSLVVLSSLMATFLLVLVFGLTVGYVLVSRENVEVLRQQKLVRSHEETALSREHTIRSYLYAADIQLAFLAYAQGEVAQARGRLLRQRPDSQSADERGFEWHYLWNLCDDEVRSYRSHQRDVFGILFSKDGKRMVTTSADRSALVWNVDDLASPRKIGDFTDDVNVPALSDDGTLLATAEENKRVRVWELATGRQAASLDGFDLPVVRVFFTGDRRHLLATEIEYNSGLGNFSLWDIASQKRLKRVEGHRALAVNTKAGILAATELNGTLSLWSLPDLEKVATWPGDGTPVLCGEFSPDGQFLATGCRGTATLWRLTDFTGRQLPLSRSTTIRGFSFNPDGSWLVSAGEDGAVKVWDVASATSLRIFESTHGRLWSVGVSPDGTTLAVACSDGSIEMRDLSRITLQKARIHKSMSEVRDVAVDVSGRQIALLGVIPQVVSILDVKSGRLMTQFSAPTGEPDDGIYSIAFAADGQSLWTESFWGRVRKRNLANGFWSDDINSPRVATARLINSPSDRFLIVSRTIWDRQLSRIVLTFDDDSAHNPMGFLNESIAMSVRVGEIRLWDLTTGRQLPPHFPTVGWIEEMAVTPDGKTLAIAAASAVHLCDVDSGRETAMLPGHLNPLSVLAISPDGRTLATGSRSGEIKLWHLPTAQHLCDLNGHPGRVRRLAFSGDGRRLVSVAQALDDGIEVFVWGLSGAKSPN